MPRDLRRSVARVLTKNAADGGTAFFVLPSGLALTCAHVAAKAVNADGTIVLEVAAPSENPLEPLILTPLRATWKNSESSARADVALLEVTGELPSWIEALPLSACDGAESLDAIESYGFPMYRQRFGDPAQGTVTGTSVDDATQHPVIEIRSRELTGGFSGAPIVNARTGQVVGMMKATLRPDPRDKFKEHAWAIPTSVIRAVAPAVQIDHHPIIAELMRVARERVPSVLDYAIETTEYIPRIPPALIVRNGDTERPLSAAQLREQIAAGQAQLVIVSGEAGSGKSSLLRGWLTRAEASTPASGRLEVPLYVRASSLAAAAGGDAVDRLWRALSEDRIASIPATYAAPDLRALMAQERYQFVLLVDGLDEIADPLRRVDTARDLREMASSLAAKGHCVVVASRPIGELDVLERGGVNVVRLRMAAVEASQRETFFREVLGSRAGDLISKFRMYERTRVGGLPMLLALTAVFYQERGTLPRSIVELMDEYLRLAAKRSARRLAVGAGNPGGPESMQYLPAIAMHSLAAPELDTAAVRSVVHRMTAASAPPQWPALALRVTVDAAVEVVATEQIAVYREGDRFRWIHQSLRDYLAGQYLADLASAGDAIRKSWPTWRDGGVREAVLFALVILSERQDVEEALAGALRLAEDSAPDEEALRFLIDALRLGIRLRPEVVDQILDATLFLGLELMDDFDTCRRLFTSQPHPFDLLTQICGVLPGAGEKLMDLIDRHDLPMNTRTRIARKLGRALQGAEQENP
jgi:hypothetical protein